MTTHLPTVLRRAASVLLLGCTPTLLRAQAAPAVSVIPYPASVTVDSAVRYVFGAAPVVALSAPANAELRALGDLAVDILRHELGGQARLAPTAAASTSGAAVSLILAPRDAAAGRESYRFDVTSGGVAITAPQPAGLFYGLQTLRALLEAERARRSPAPATLAEATLPGMRITDAPRFSYRGLHLDVGRHFSPVAFVKRYIDLMSRYKYNTFHWHLTEDQGWRIEIKKYPRLTEVGGCRKETQLARNRNPYVGDSIRYCGWYTQDQIRDVVAYAKTRHVTVIPEIEMPGHAKAALAAYPELGCGPGPYEVWTTWGVDPNIFCPKEETFTFLENVLTEVMALFPSTYIHIGGDEAPKTVWQQSPIAQAVIKREKLKDEHELQSYFIRRMEKFLNAHGRQLIGWDEILEGGLAPKATVMSWRGINGGIAAARQNHDVVMTPTSHTYFDYIQGDRRYEPTWTGSYLPIETVYAFEPTVPDSLTADQAKHIIGTQGQLWTEYMYTTSHVEYMAYPRALALAEVAWSPKSARDYESFRKRLLPRLLGLDRLGVNYRFPSADNGLERNRVVSGDSIVVELRSALPEAEIRYTLDGSQPTPTSARYTGPLRLALPADGISVLARTFLGTHVGPVRAATFRRAR
ncbi:MAG TPA: family 20 glycosylhydrolase [Gemmatimonadaceae bacterium]|nr:family 20 glycosylhydrolase [Gemmatimonadaceae bacterium]